MQTTLMDFVLLCVRNLKKKIQKVDARNTSNRSCLCYFMEATFIFLLLWFSVLLRVTHCWWFHPLPWLLIIPWLPVAGKQTSRALIPENRPSLWKLRASVCVRPSEPMNKSIFILALQSHRKKFITADLFWDMLKSIPGGVGGH